MLDKVKQLFNKIPVSWRHITILITVLVIILNVWLYGTQAFNAFQNWRYQRGSQARIEQLEKTLQEADQVKKERDQLKQELEQAKQDTAAERAKRELLEQVLADKSKTSAQKLKAYEEALRKNPTHTEPTTDVDAICERAKSLGVPC